MTPSNVNLRPRDLIGYGINPPKVAWPDAARVAVSFVVNFEEGAEYSIADGDSRNEAVYEATERLESVPDYCLQSHYDYGTRAAWWRIMNLLDAHDIKCTVNACGLAVQRSPELAKDAVDRGHEISAHGWRWESHAHLDKSAEQNAIEKTVNAITEATGIPPVGWHTRSSPSSHTRSILMDRDHFIYDSDFYGDDLPVILSRPDGTPYVVLPYAFDTNDMQFHHAPRFVSADDFSDYVSRAFDWLWREGEETPKMMTIGLHLRIIGRPARMWALEKIIEHIKSRGSAWITTRENIARHWLSATDR
ncbi:polysaccharide deacetylase family protein [Acidihalobacter ferrooxydans]|uniref:Chitin deacetylase n=1 Tax=Acidihalobacter ferrooxydans TaxID=1765967 RepID=A0A1P8UIT3_9GAMM|nr:polysaccharide deacetylase family protein [Acidihalobacter ferrooxydans]APZ43745.1 chitin deacetylase [Acidihalobacter ferrooxydans]